MKIGDLIRLRPEFLGIRKAELEGTVYLIIGSDIKPQWFGTSNRDSGHWKVMDSEGNMSKVSVNSEFAYEVVSDVRNCYDDNEGHINR